jgi:FlaA1/EpsC-like NDP-sugar epimerase
MFTNFSRSLCFLDFLICLQVTTGLRVVARIARELTACSIGRGVRKRILIYGAGAGGVMLLRELRANSVSTHEVCGFIDDDHRKQGMLIDRVAILGSGQDLAEQTRRKNVAEILIAIPSARGPQMAQILQHCHAAGAPCKTMPGLAEFVVSARAAAQIRDVAVEDLLGRNPVHLDEETIRHKLEGRTILVTGAGGSIGSELCLQIARFRPQTVVGLDIAESALFNIQQELIRLFPELHFCPEIGSIRNNQRIYEVFRKYKPSTVYHAAAYKHVPLMEEHPFEAVENNVFGTWQIATMAGRFRVEHFVMISSDKAVRPTSIMGATKRTAELIIYAIQNGGTKYMSVRFGNVLGSNGSVIPTFKKQIAVGGPVIVTHPEMRRYFMTIPEATQLVLQASTMGSGGEIFELEMGEQVKIADLAKNLILLSGLRPGEDVKITFTRPRPGEKLYEELSSHDEHTIPTYHEKIKILMGNGIPNQFLTNLRTLKQSCESRNICNLVMKLKEIVPEYNPGSDLLRNILTNDEYSKTPIAELAEL